MKLIALLYIFHCAVCFNAVPLAVASHRLVKGLKNELPEIKPSTRYNGQEVTNMLKRLITDCSSDGYVLIDIPGLKVYDINDYSLGNWNHLGKYFSMASTVMGLSFINDVLDLEYLKQYIITTCDAEPLDISMGGNTNAHYIDTRTRAISIKFDHLSEDHHIRQEQIKKNDQFIREVIGKLPSPHYTIILTSSEKAHIEPVPPSAFNNYPQNHGVFNKIANHISRAQEIEFNDKYMPVEPHWNENKNSNQRYLENKKKDEVKFLDYELWMKNEKIIMTITLMVMTVFMIKLKALFGSLGSIF